MKKPKLSLRQMRTSNMGMSDGQWKAYLREELKNQQVIQEAMENKDYEKTVKLIE